MLIHKHKCIFLSALVSYIIVFIIIVGSFYIRFKEQSTETITIDKLSIVEPSIYHMLDLDTFDCFSIWEGSFPYRFCCHIIAFQQLCNHYVLFSNTFIDLYYICEIDVDMRRYDYPEVLRVMSTEMGGYSNFVNHRLAKVLISDYTRATIALKYEASYFDIDFFHFKIPDRSFVLYDWYEETILNGVFNLTNCPEFLSEYIRYFEEKVMTTPFDKLRWNDI